MSKKLSFTLSMLCVLASAQFAQGRNVFVLPPGDGTLRPIIPLVGDPFGSVSAGISAAQDSFLAFALPNGTKYYFVGRSSTDTVVITDGNFNVIGRRNLGLGATGAALSPDGRFLVVLAGTAQIFRTDSDQVAGQVDTGGSSNDVAISRDSTRAFVTSSSGRLTSIDLVSFQTLGVLQNLGPVNGVSVGPNTLVYVAAQNVLYEIDPRDLTFRNGAGISLNAQAGKPAFAADGLGGLRVIVPNLNPQFGGSSAVSVDLGTRVGTPIFANNAPFDKLIPVSGNRVFAVSSSNSQLYDITLPNGAVQANFTGIGAVTGVRSAVASNEFPSARFLYLATTTNNAILRIDLSTNSLSGSVPIGTPPGQLSYAGPSATGIPSAVFTFNNGQFLNPSAQSLPLIIRAVDGTGKPLSGVPVQFNPGVSGANITSATSTVTDGEGYAQAIVVSPGTLGQFTITANVGSGTVLTTTFTLTVGTGTSGPTGLIAARSGNGQVIRESSQTPDPLRVIVRDTAGNPIPNATVNWTVNTVNGPNGSLVNSVTTTDFFGESVNTYIAPFLGPSLIASYVQSTITASTISGSVSMYVTVIPNLFLGNPVSFPAVQILAPTNTDTIRGQVGSTLPGAIQFKVNAAAGPSVGTAIPNVGINVTTGLDPSVAPTARCADNTGLTDSTGVGTCDLVLGGKIGMAPLTLTVGGSGGSSTTFNLILDPGVPGKVTIVAGDNQSGAAGATLPLALLARIEDNFGNALPNVPVAWTVDSGSATLINTINRADNQARVSTLVRLGNAPGAVKISVTAQGGAATAKTTFTANVIISATQINRISGDAQSATVNTAFTDPLIAQVLDANAAGVPGVPVTFTVRSGSATLGSASATSDSSGFIRTTVTAGNAPGPVTISADLAGNSVTWTLTVRALGPTITTIINEASRQNLIAPGSVATIRGSNIVSTLRGYLLPSNDYGARPTTLGGVTVTFGGVAAPIFWVANLDGQESVTVQVPFEAGENTTVPVTVTSGGTSASQDVAISAFAPGIFETTDSQGRTYAVAARPDGSFVTPDNAAVRGETIRVFVTGLGRTTPPATTNSSGVGGQNVNGGVIVGVNDAGVQVVNAQYAQNLIGVYVVSFVVPADTATGTARNLSVAADTGGGILAYSNGSNLAIR